MKSSFATGHSAVMKILCLWQCTVSAVVRSHFFTEVCASPLFSEETSRKNFLASQISTSFWTAWCSILVFVAISLIVTHPFSSTSPIFPLFQYSLWATTMVLFSDVWVPVLKVLYLSSSTAGAHAGVCVCALKSCTNISCWDFLPSTNTVTVHCQNNMSPPAILSHWNVTTWQGLVMWFSF